MKYTIFTLFTILLVACPSSTDSIDSSLTDIDGTLTYEDTIITAGNSTSISPSWNDITDESQTVLYTIEPATEGIIIAEANGNISIADTVPVMPKTTYTITATGTDKFANTVTGTIDITVFSTTTTTYTSNSFIGPTITDSESERNIIIITMTGLPVGETYTYTLGTSTGTKTVDTSGTITITQDDLKNTDATDGATLTLDGEGISNVIIATYKPNTIYTWHDLQAMRGDLSKSYTLASDITFPDPTDTSDDFPEKGFAPIGDSTNPFTGTLDGNNNTISGFYINDNTRDYAGLFGVISHTDSSTEVVTNLTFDSPNITAKAIAGTIAGLIESGSIENISIINTNDTTILTSGTSAISSITLRTSSQNNAHTGGVVGFLKSGRLINVSSAVHVHNTDKTTYSTGIVGGLVGLVGDQGHIVHSSSTGNVEGLEYVGGIVGYAIGKSSIHGYSSGDITGYRYVGGLVGYTARYKGSTVQNPVDIEGYANASLTVSHSNAGGLVGGIAHPTSLIGYYVGDIATQWGESGGLVGGINIPSGIINITGYALGSVSGGYKNGGLVGRISSYAASFYITGYARNNISGNGNLGRLVGTTGTLLGDQFKGYYSTQNNESSITSSTGFNGVGVDVSSSHRSEGAFTDFTFGSNTGEWTFVAAGKWPAINIGTLQPSEDQPTH